MKNISKVLFFCLILVSVQTYAQISVTTGMTAQQYVEEVLLSGGVTVSNISFTGSSRNWLLYPVQFQPTLIVKWFNFVPRTS